MAFSLIGGDPLDDIILGLILELEMALEEIIQGLFGLLLQLKNWIQLLFEGHLREIKIELVLITAILLGSGIFLMILRDEFHNILVGPHLDVTRSHIR